MKFCKHMTFVSNLARQCLNYLWGVQRKSARVLSLGLLNSLDSQPPSTAQRRNRIMQNTAGEPILSELPQNTWPQRPKTLAHVVLFFHWAFEAFKQRNCPFFVSKTSRLLRLSRQPVSLKLDHSVMCLCHGIFLALDLVSKRWVIQCWKAGGRNTPNPWRFTLFLVMTADCFRINKNVLEVWWLLELSLQKAFEMRANTHEVPTVWRCQNCGRLQTASSQRQMKTYGRLLALGVQRIWRALMPKELSKFQDGYILQCVSVGFSVPKTTCFFQNPFFLTGRPVVVHPRRV